MSYLKLSKDKPEQTVDTDNALYSSANKKIESVIKYLLMDRNARERLSFFLKGLINMKIEFMEPEEIVSSIDPTAYTDGERIVFNPALVELLDRDSLIFVVAHEVLHNCLDHCYRGKGKNGELWNIAIDFCVNGILYSVGINFNSQYILNGNIEYFKIIKDLILPDKSTLYFDGQSEDQVYDLLIKGAKKSIKSRTIADVVSKSKNDKGSGSSKNEQQIREDWSVFNKENSNDIKKIIDISSSLKDCILYPQDINRLNWKDEIVNFLNDNIRKTDWSRPNRRNNGTLVFNPRKYSVTKKRILLAIDSSGSISDEEMGEFLTYVIDLLSQTGLSATLLKFDTQINDRIEIDSSQYDLNELMRRTCYGGTDFDCIFEFILENENEYGGLIIFSDMFANISGKYTDYDAVPSLFVSNNNRVNIKVPGRIIYVK